MEPLSEINDPNFIVDNTLARPEDETDQIRIETLRNKLQDDLYLLRFLRYKKNDVNLALKAITNYWEERHRLSKLTDNVYPSRYVEHYQSRFCVPLAHRDKFGRQVVIWKFENWDVSKVPLLEFFQSEFCVCDIISSRQLTQLHGTVFILDLAGLSLAHVKACTWSTLRLLGSITNGYPMKIKGVHFLHHPSIFNAIFAMAKLTMKPKLIKRVKFHGNDTTSLHKYVAASILPECYGGLLKDDEYGETDFIQTMLKKEQYFKDLCDTTKFGYLTKISKS